jgi:hypothetical protein
MVFVLVCCAMQIFMAVENKMHGVDATRAMGCVDVFIFGSMGGFHTTETLMNGYQVPWDSSVSAHR